MLLTTNDCADFAAIRNSKCFVLFARGVIEITTLKLGLKASRVKVKMKRNEFCTNPQ